MPLANAAANDNPNPANDPAVDPAANPMAEIEVDPVAAALQALTAWQAEADAELQRPYQFDFNNPRLARARRVIAGLRSWLFPPRRFQGVSSQDIAAALVLLTGLSAEGGLADARPLAWHVSPRRAPGAGRAGGARRAAALLLRHAPGDVVGDQVGRAARLHAAPREAAGQASILWAIRYGRWLLDPSVDLLLGNKQ